MRLTREQEPPLPYVDGGFSAILADPAWEYDSGDKRIRPKYPTMPIEEIGNMPVESLAADIALLFLWTTIGFTEAAYWVCRRWGFVPKGQLIWCKGRIAPAKNGRPERLVQQISKGSYVRPSHELVIIGSRGGATGLARNIPSVLLASRSQHSKKPAAIYPIVEALSPGPYLELFARNEREGWASWGNELAT